MTDTCEVCGVIKQVSVLPTEYRVCRSCLTSLVLSGHHFYQRICKDCHGVDIKELMLKHPQGFWLCPSCVKARAKWRRGKQ